ncbi:MAG: hypothetical protein P0Y56_03595 [Candidatus Andeanibacterium colombiense]|uniref:Uncharacterized protein n=1 Tax=Candidatus Andeanibacterium colombiense TaxID=3121345 RepID=A0AAJ5X7Q5_9SPHN|nr:MAG: hypothetical protein P0Y56_03595 [Sphingomonadaceae bacterium]
MIRAVGIAPLAGIALLAAAAPGHAVDPPADSGFEIDDAAAFKAAGFKLIGDGWQSCGETDDPSYVPGQIDQIADLDGDGAPEAVISESSSACYGATGSSYAIVSSDKAGKWRLIDSGVGIPIFLATRGAGNWPDLEVGGPGLCFPVLRWNGTAYAPNRFEYEGKPCKG